MGRIPAAVMRWTMKSGVGAAGSKPSTRRATNTGHPSASSTTTGWPSSLAAGVSRSAGSRKPLAPSTETSDLAGDAAQGQRVGPVGVDLELDDLLVEAEHRTDVLAGLAGVGRQHDDAVVVLAEAELAGRADHAGGEVAIGLAGADLEAAREHAAGKHRDDEVAAA